MRREKEPRHERRLFPRVVCRYETLAERNLFEADSCGNSSRKTKPQVICRLAGVSCGCVLSFDLLCCADFGVVCFAPSHPKGFYANSLVSLACCLVFCCEIVFNNHASPTFRCSSAAPPAAIHHAPSHPKGFKGPCFHQDATSYNKKATPITLCYKKTFAVHTVYTCT